MCARSCASAAAKRSSAAASASARVSARARCTWADLLDQQGGTVCGMLAVSAKLTVKPCHPSSPRHAPCRLHAWQCVVGPLSAGLATGCARAGSCTTANHRTVRSCAPACQSARSHAPAPPQSAGLRCARPDCARPRARLLHRHPRRLLHQQSLPPPQPRPAPHAR